MPTELTSCAVTATRIEVNGLGSQEPLFNPRQLVQPSGRCDWWLSAFANGIRTASTQRAPFAGNVDGPSTASWCRWTADGQIGPVTTIPALTNALFAATGERIRSLPLGRHGWRLA